MSNETFAHLPVSSVAPNPGQPRKHFEKSAMAELTDSVRSLGVMEPIVVRPCEGGYVIVAGERRWRAAVEAGLEAIPALVRDDLDEDSAFLLSMVENLLRADMNPVEEADGYQKLLEQGLTVEALAARIGKTAAAIRSSLTLLKLDVPIRELVQKGHLSAWDGTRLATLSINGQHQALKLIQEKGLTGNDRDRVIGQLWLTERQPEMFGDIVSESAERTTKGRSVRSDVENAARLLARAAEAAPDALLDDYTVELVEAVARYTARLSKATRAARTARMVNAQLVAV